MPNLMRAVLLAFGVLMMSSVLQAGQLKQRVPAPALTQTDPQAWLNSEPLSLQDLSGKVVLLDFWTFDCWNCYRSFPWLNALEKTFAGESFTVLGIHTPEFDHEKVRDNVAEKIKEFELHHPVMMDNDFAYWRAMGNRYWPAFYLLDKQGRVRSVYIGETHANTAQANAIEADIRQLLAEG
ncbi:redoxin family protein [Aliamphritea ceti]|uniref:redoxin family protein n=1 Tax=Aliamphritea ceti TaxID=1524258 RepID=UPI0021C3FE49|nr:redoxin domain-containing protein [Aliamphritea ceti]